MKNQLISSLFLLLCLACEKAPSIPNYTHQIDELANRYLALERFSGTILVAKKDQLLFQQAYGLADYENQIAFSEATTFKIGTLTQLFTAYIIQQMGKEQLIDVEDPINKYLKEIESTLTIKELLNEEQSENNANYNLLGQLIESRLNLSFQKAIAHYFKPLGLTDTYFQRENTNNAKGYLFHNYRGRGMELEIAPNYNMEEAFSSYGLKSTVADLWKFALISPDLSIDKSGYLDNDGFSYTFQKDNNLTIIILSNRRHPISKEIATSIRAIYEHQSYELPLLREPVVINSNLFKTYQGTYQVNPNFQFDVLSKNDSLFSVIGNRTIPLIPQSTNQFYYQDFDAAIRFVKDSMDRVRAAILYNGFIEGQEVAKIK